MIDWILVDSHAIRALSYDLSRSLLYIDFKNSTPQYTYRNVPMNVFNDFLTAPSKGRFYNCYIKDRYSF